jgi:uncharacterized YccA/Bax inhibitor family protein
MRTANPVFSDRVYTVAEGQRSGTMTVNGTVERSLLFLAMVIGAAAISWKMFVTHSPAVIPLVLVGSIGGLILAVITCFRPQAAAVTGSLYCIAEGLVLGVISAAMEASYPGIALNAMLMTFGVFAAMLVLYRAGVLRATPGFTRGVVAATAGICLVYVVDMVLHMMGSAVPFIHESGLMGIGISVVIVIVAALNLILDFEMVVQGAAAGYPKYMEWYGAFGLMVTLVWLYLEILRLLAKMRRR